MNLSNKKSYFYIAGLVLFLAIAFFVVWAMNSQTSDTPTATATPPTNCVSATDYQIEAIAAFIHGDYRIGDGFAKHYGNGYFVSANIFRSNADIPLGVGVWYVFGTSFEPRSVLLVNEFGKTATPNLSLASTTDFGYSMDDDDAQYVESCTLNN